MKQLRQTNYELLRIIAILLISLMHGIRSAYGSSYPLNDIAHISVTAIGNTGVTLFVLISGYFGIKLRPSKVFRLWSIILFYSLLIFGIRWYLKEFSMPDLPETDNLKELVKQFYKAITPLSSGTWWFVSSYFILLILAPLINKAADNLSRFHFQYLLFILFVFYSLSPTLLRHSFSNETCGKCTENMILAYFIGRYIAKFGIPKLIRNNCLPILTGCLILIFSINYFIFDPLFMSKDNNIFIIIGAICIFHLFGKLTFTKQSTGIIIRYLATYAFPIYLLNIFLIDHIEPYYIEYHNSPVFLLYYFVAQCIILVLSFVIELFRRLLMDPFINTLSKRIDNWVKEWLQKKMQPI